LGQFNALATFDTRQAQYLRFKKKRPNASFAEFLTESHCRSVTKGKRENPSGAIEVALGDSETFWKSGEAHAHRLFAEMSLRRDHKVIEYGCGSLRLAAHFIRYLDPEHFFGLDVISGYYELGKAAIEQDILEEKSPQFAVISDASIAQAQEFGADRVYSNLVCVHVHPDEIGTYFQNLVRLTHRPGSRLIFNAEISDTAIRYKFNCWAWPMAFYRESLCDLDFVGATVGRPRSREGFEVKPAEFEFRR
jgi:cyclopropane fatty-acyl-phospholipid synthase-like methyltransferase